MNDQSADGGGSAKKQKKVTIVEDEEQPEPSRVSQLPPQQWQ